jgi:hypothetical protein
MSTESNIDIESLQRSRWKKARDRMDVLFGWVRQRGWVEAEAEVLACVPGRTHVVGRSGWGGPVAGGWVVTFIYIVDGKSYEGTTISQEKVEPGEIISVRFNPRRPAQNDSFDSETDWTVPVSHVEMALLALFVLGAILMHYFPLR